MVSNIGQAEEVFLPTIESEAKFFLGYLSTLPLEEQQDTIAFTTAFVPKSLQDSTVLSLSFVCHSLVGISDNDESAAGYYPIAMASYNNLIGPDIKPTVKLLSNVPGSKTLFYIRLSNFNWTRKSWEQIVNFDGYVKVPIISELSSGAMRLLSGSSLVRADWFIARSGRTVDQTDQNNKINPIYRELLYSKTKQPKTVDQFRRTWGMESLERSRQLGAEVGVLTVGSSIVARHNRLLFGYKTLLGYYYASYDVKFETGKRDYVDTFYELKAKPPQTVDGGELIASTALGLQAYDIYDGKENLVDFAPSEVVRSTASPTGDVRVVVANECFFCHSKGLISSLNTISDYLKNNGGAYYHSREDKLRTERAFLSDKFEDSIIENQKLFEKALLKVNGLKPDDNLNAYLAVTTWYNQPLTLEQCAVEIGVLPEIIKEKAKIGLGVGNIPGRLALLLNNSKPIPRAVWESNENGTFQQTAILVNGLTKIITQTDTTLEYDGVVLRGCKLFKSGTEVIKIVDANDKIRRIGVVSGEYTDVIMSSGEKGWIQSIYIKKGK